MKSEDKVGHFTFVGKIMHVAYIMAAIFFRLLLKPSHKLISLRIAIDLKDFDLLGRWVLGQWKQKE